MAGIARKWIARRASHLLHTEPLFVVSSYRGSINAGPRIDPARFRFRRLVQSLRLPPLPRMDSSRWSYPVNRPPANRSVGFAILPPNSRTYWRWFMKIYVAYEWAGDEKDRAIPISMIALWTVDRACFQILRFVFGDYIFDIFFKKVNIGFYATFLKWQFNGNRNGGILEFYRKTDDFLPKLVHAILKHLRSSSSRSRIFINGRIILNRSPFLIFSRATGLGWRQGLCEDRASYYHRSRPSTITIMRPIGFNDWSVNYRP